MVFDIVCLNCDKDFKSTYIVDNFCCHECQVEYWDNPKKVQITTDCPYCQRTFSRDVYTIECRGYQALVLCENCK